MHVLLIGSYFFPVRSVASIRWTRLIKYMVRDGLDVGVLTDRKNLRSKTNYSYLCGVESESVSDYVGRDRLFEFDLSFVSKLWNIESNRRQAKRRGGRKAVGSGGTGASAPNWARALKRSELVAKSAIRQYSRLADRYDVVISTFDPLWPHMVARRFKELNPDLVWVADFRDPVYGAGRFEDPSSLAWAAEVTDSADAVTYVAEGGDGLLNLPEGRTTILSNGFDPDDMEGVERGGSDRFRVVYTGTLCDGEESRRDLVPILQTIQSLVDDGLVNPQDVVFEYAGTTSELFEKQLRRVAPLSFDCRDLGYVSRQDALNLQGSASLLAIATWNTAGMQGVVTGKLWEYLMSGVPVIGTCTGEVPGSRMKEILDETGGGIMLEECNAAEDAVAAKEFVLAKYREWKESGRTTTDTNWAYLSRYSHENLAKRVEEVVTRAAASRQVDKNNKL